MSKMVDESPLGNLQGLEKKFGGSGGVKIPKRVVENFVVRWPFYSEDPPFWESKRRVKVQEGRVRVRSGHTHEGHLPTSQLFMQLKRGCMVV